MKANTRKYELVVFNLGQEGVNVDLSPAHQQDGMLRKSQNASPNTLGAEVGLSNRPGLIEINSNIAAGSVLGGVGVPLLNLFTGARFWFIGRGPKT